MAWQLTSAAFGDKEAIPLAHTCDGDNTSPGLRWSAVPSGTRSLALIVHDPDARAGDFTHWVLYDLPSAITELPSGKSSQCEYPLGGRQGRNGFGELGYGGPCPPAGATHHYVFTLYALSQPSLNLPPGADAEQVNAALRGGVLAQAQLTGIYRRP